MSRHGIGIIKDMLDKQMLKLEPHGHEPRPVLRSSSLPFCPLKRFYEMTTEDIDSSKYFSLEQRFFLGIGSEVHELLQRWFVKYFDEAVTIIGADENNEMCEYRPGDPKYIEVSLKTDYLTGHVDGIYLVNETQECYVVDYKTVSTHLMTKYRNPDKRGQSGLPKNPHKYQLRSYMHLLRPLLRDYGIGIEAGLLIYVNRDMPKFEIIEVPVPDYDMEQELRAMNEGYQALLGYDGTYDAALAEKCEGLAICDTREFYDREVHDKSSPCPLADVCFDRDELWKKLSQLE